MKIRMHLQKGCHSTLGLRERPLMMSDYRRMGGSEMTPKNWTLKGKNWTLGWDGGVKNRQKSSDIIYG